MWACPSKKGAYGFSNVMRANDVDDVIYDVTIGNVQHAAHMLQQKTETFIFWGISAKWIKTYTVLEYWNIPNKKIENNHKSPFRLGQLMYILELSKEVLWMHYFMMNLL